MIAKPKRPLPAEARDDEHRADRGKNVARGIQRKHNAAGAERAVFLWKHLRGVGSAHCQFPRAADAGQEAKEREDVEIERDAAQRRGDTVENDRVTQSVTSADAIGEETKSDRADRVAHKENRSD